MINLPEEIQKQYDENVSDFQTNLDVFHQNLKIIRIAFLSAKLTPLKKEESSSDFIASSFIIQFIPFLDYLVFFSKDEEVLAKLKELRFYSGCIKLMVNINSIEKEIRRLVQIDGLLIFPNDFLLASIGILQLKFKIEFLGSNGFDKRYNNSNSNKIFIEFANRLRRRLDTVKSTKKSSQNDYEILMNIQLDIVETVSLELGLEKDSITKNTLKMLKGNVKDFTNLFMFHCNDISKRTAYSELFPLLKLILKDKKLFNETEFYNDDHDKSYDGNYKTYKSKIVEKFLLKK